MADGESGASAAVGRGAGVRSNLNGALWMVFSGLAATGMTVAIRVLSDTLPSSMSAFLRAGLGALALAPIALWPVIREARAPRIRLARPWLHLLRGALTSAALILGFEAVAKLPLTVATILFFLAPIFATALAGPLLGERVGPRRWTAVACGFVGAAIILRPGVAPLEPAAAAAIGSAACFSVALTLSRIIGRDDSASSILVTTTVIAALATAPFAALVWTPPTTGVEWFWVATMVTLATARMFADIRAYMIAEAGFLAPFTYLRLVFTAIVAWAAFDETLDAWTLVGGGVIVGSTLYIAARERRPGATP